MRRKRRGSKSGDPRNNDKFGENYKFGKKHLERQKNGDNQKKRQKQKEHYIDDKDNQAFGRVNP